MDLWMGKGWRILRGKGRNRFCISFDQIQYCRQLATAFSVVLHDKASLSSGELSEPGSDMLLALEVVPGAQSALIYNVLPGHAARWYSLGVKVASQGHFAPSN